MYWSIKIVSYPVSTASFFLDVGEKRQGGSLMPRPRLLHGLFDVGQTTASIACTGRLDALALHGYVARDFMQHCVL